jgi:two-component system, NarL family, response regulator DevR
MSVVLCSKDALLRDGLESLLKHEGGFDVVATESRVTAALATAKVLKSLVAVIDEFALDAKDFDRLSAARSKTSLYIVLLSDDRPKQGPHGKAADLYVARSKGSASLLKAVSEIVSRNRGRRLSVREPTARYGTPHSLTAREFEVAQKVAEGMSNRDIADYLDLAEQTVKNLVSVVMRKLACRNRVQVALRLSRPSGSTS